MNVLDHNDSQAYIIYSSILVSFLKRSALHYFFTNKRSFQTFGPALQIEIQKILRCMFYSTLVRPCIIFL